MSEIGSEIILFMGVFLRIESQNTYEQVISEDYNILLVRCLHSGCPRNSTLQDTEHC